MAGTRRQADGAADTEAARHPAANPAAPAGGGCHPGRGGCLPGCAGDSGPLATSFRAVDRTTGVSGRAQLHGTPAGTEIDLAASGLQGGERCILVAVARDDADIAGTWNATYDGSARIAGMSAFPASQLTALRIESDSGRLLLSIRV